MFEEVDLSNAEKHQTIKNILCGTHHGGKGSNFFWFVGQNDKSVYNFKTKIDPDSGNYLLHADKTTLEETEQSVGFFCAKPTKKLNIRILGFINYENTLSLKVEKANLKIDLPVFEKKGGAEAIEKLEETKFEKTDEKIKKNNFENSKEKIINEGLDFVKKQASQINNKSIRKFLYYMGWVIFIVPTLSVLPDLFGGYFFQALFIILIFGGIGRVSPI